MQPYTGHFPGTTAEVRMGAMWVKGEGRVEVRIVYGWKREREDVPWNLGCRLWSKQEVKVETLGSYYKMNLTLVLS